MTLSDSIISAAQNQLFAGIVGGSLVVSLMVALKSVPQQLWEAAKWRLTCSLTVFNEDAAFERVSEWLSELKGAADCRRLRLTSWWDPSTETEVERLSPGLGTHLFWYRGRPLLVRRNLPDKSAVGGAKRLEDITVSTLGSSPTVLHDLLAEIRAARVKMRGATIDVYLYRNRWRLVCRKPKRHMRTVVLPAQQKRKIIADVDRFLCSRSWYAQRGVPYRRGYLFEGPPGCGKSSLALAIASEFSRPIYALNLGSINGDVELIEAVSECPEHAVLLIEDVDAAGASATKRRVEPEISATPLTTNKAEDPQQVSLSALLNVIDGVFARDGRILIMTTNHPERIDPALLRPGRADRREHIGPLGRDEAVELSERFLGDEADGFVGGVKLPIAASDLQEMLLQAETRAEFPRAAE